jgi:hypothetical protein
MLDPVTLAAVMFGPATVHSPLLVRPEFWHRSLIARTLAVHTYHWGHLSGAMTRWI